MKKIMITMTALSFLIIAGFFPRASEGVAQEVIAIHGATVHTAAGPLIANATIIVRNGKIAEVGTNVSTPAGAKVYDVAGKFIVPGMMDNHSHIGAGSTALNDFPMVIGPQHRPIDALDLNRPDWKEAVKGGVTTVGTGAAARTSADRPLSLRPSAAIFSGAF